MRRPNRFPQLDLFRPTCRRPDWRQLPVEVREKATRLMARMLGERRRRGPIGRAAGGRDDE